MGVVRKTKALDTILSFFQATDRAVSVVELVNKVSTQMNKTTVYRILDRLEDEGVVHSFSGTKGLKWYAKCHQCSTEHHNDLHPHFECKECGKVECLDLNITIPQVADRQIESADLILTGKCVDCVDK